MGPDLTIVATLVFIATIALSLYTLLKNESLYWRMVLNPYRVVHQKQYQLLLTSGFIHADITHLLFNMITFYFFAFHLERIAGAIPFAIIYLGSMILSDISTVIKHRNNPDYNSVGASGAVSGVLFATILYNPSSSIMIFPIPIPIPAVIFALMYLAYSHFSSKRGGDHINHEAHLWGALAGVILTIILEPGIVPAFIAAVF